MAAVAVAGASVVGATALEVATDCEIDEVARRFSAETAETTADTCPATTPDSSRAPTKTRANRWLGPEKGNALGMPPSRTAAKASTMTQATNCNHASQTMATRIVTTCSMPI
ncbi:MAG: hypothetical protein BWY91_02112 [bacterium ADurb.BinA028]|nr:MAG: hypothetical protein BWY91_02112 [bacterium ADurb.BinA028]